MEWGLRGAGPRGAGGGKGDIGSKGLRAALTFECPPSPAPMLSSPTKGTWEEEGGLL